MRGGTVVDSTGARRADVLVKGEVVVAVGQKLGSAPAGAVVLDASGCFVSPGLVDLHTHLREPGAEESETIETGPGPPPSVVTQPLWPCRTPSRRQTRLPS